MNDTEISFQGFLPSNDLIIKDENTFDEIMPFEVSPDFTVKNIQWSDFKGQVKEGSPWIAHTYWSICYSYQIILKKVLPPVPLPLPPSNKIAQLPKQQIKISNNNRFNSPINKNIRTISSRSPSSTSTRSVSLNKDLKQSNCFSKAQQKPSYFQNNISQIQKNAQQIKQQPSQQQIQKAPSGSLTPKSQQTMKITQNQNLQQDIKSLQPNLKSMPSQKNERSSSQQKQEQEQKILTEPLDQGEIKLKISAETKLSPNSWVCDQWELLLDHERGHYLIGCLCALEFKRRAEEQIWTQRDQELKEAVLALFRTVIKEISVIERNYDEETNHYMNQKMQKKWNRKIKEQLYAYRQHFKNFNYEFKN